RSALQIPQLHARMPGIPGHMARGQLIGPVGHWLLVQRYQSRGVIHQHRDSTGDPGLGGLLLMSKHAPQDDKLHNGETVMAKSGKSKSRRPGLPAPRTVVARLTLTAPRGPAAALAPAPPTYRILRTTQVDEYESPVAPEAALALARAPV